MTLTSHEFCDTCGAANRPQAQFCRACGQPLRAPATTISISNTLTGLLTPQHMLKQRYMILGPAGRGGFGAVYKAMDMQLGNRLVAVKEMSQGHLTTLELDSATQAFTHEAVLLARLKHPNLPPVYEQFSDLGRAYLVMDFIDGETLEDRLKGLHGKLVPIEEALKIGIQLSSVLEYLHSQEPAIIFRDLKPANVMLTSSGHAYLIDFGIARYFKPGQAKDTTALGSSGYAAPEQYGRSQSTPRADIYALGATLHQLLSGADPTASPFHFAPLNFSAQPALAGLDTLIMSMLSVEIERRPASASFVKKELERVQQQYLAGQTPGMLKIPEAYQAPQKTPRGSRTLKPPVQAQIRPLANMLYVSYGHTSRITGLAWSPDGSKIASVSYDKTVRVWNANTGKDVLTCTGHRDHINSVTWSPDSKKLATGGNDGLVLIWDATTGKQIFSYSQHTSHVNTVVWSPDGTKLASAGADKTVQVWETTADQILRAYNGHTGAVCTLDWSPDSKRVASGGDDCQLHVWEWEREPHKRSLWNLFSAQRDHEIYKGHQKRINALDWSLDGKRIATASSDYDVYVWDAATGHKMQRIVGNDRKMKNAVGWSPDGKHIAVAGNDKTVTIYNVLTKKEFPYRGHVGYVCALAWSPDGSKVASAGVDRSLQVWASVVASSP